MKLIGANLGEKEVEYKDLEQWPFFSDDRQKIVKRLSDFYRKIKEECKLLHVSAFPQKNGKVEIIPGMINHKCTNSLSNLNTISQYGVLASEWFGQIESEREGIFCAFIDRIHNEDDKNNRGRILNRQTLKSRGNNIILFFDSSNPIMQRLLHLDFFEFEKVKQLTPEKLDELYTKDEIQLFQQIIEPFSPGGKSFHINNLLPYCDWSAIPGGIPAELINGICTKTIQYDEEYMNELKKLFPNATIFNSELEILHTPEKVKNTVLQQREEELSALEAEEKIISEAEALIDKQTEKEGQDIGE